MTPPASPRDDHYLLGHSREELERLDLQGALYRDVTVRAFRAAGLRPGMRVLDIGCGSGDVSLTAAEVVGEGGYVLGIDREVGALDAARERARSAEAGQVEFLACAISDFDRPGAFDALVGRFVLMHQPDPAATLRNAARAVRPGGVVVMIESYMQLLLDGAHSEPHSPLYDALVRWQCEVVRGAGADPRAGARLPRIFREAGLPEPSSVLEAPLEGGADTDYYRYVARSVASMRPEAGRRGLVGFADADPDRLADQLRDEVVGTGGALLAWPVVRAHCRVV